jgi:hypothetical protein
MRVHPESVLFITLDSCRYDTFAAASCPNMRNVGPLHKADAPSYSTYNSHSAMFMGFTPGLASVSKPLLNPKFGKVFKVIGAGFPGKGGEAFAVTGRNIVDGFNRLGYRTIGTGSQGFFNPATPSGELLTEEFQRFCFHGTALAQQVAWVTDQTLEARGPVFAFLNAGETHVPYWHDGATWSADWNPCVPFSGQNDRRECQRRQLLCVEYCDIVLAPLLRAFSYATILLCSDHGDCWGEDGLWEHGIHHEMTLKVPLLLRVRGNPTS